MISAQLAFDPSLKSYVELHKRDIGSVAKQQCNALVVGNVVIQEEYNEHNKSNNIKADISKQRPPGEVQNLPREECAHTDHEQNVKDRGTHDGSDAHVAVRDEHANHGREELGGGASGGHEGGTRHIVRNLELFRDDGERGNEELVAHDGEGDEHVGHPEHVEHDSALSPLLECEQVLGIISLAVFARRHHGNGRMFLTWRVVLDLGREDSSEWHLLCKSLVVGGWHPFRKWPQSGRKGTPGQERRDGRDAQDETEDPSRTKLSPHELRSVTPAVPLRRGGIWPQVGAEELHGWWADQGSGGLESMERQAWLHVQSA